MGFRLFTASGNVQDKQLDSLVSDIALVVPLKAGQGAAFPEAITGQCTSLGSQTILNETGISAKAISVGDHIANVSDGSSATVVSISADSIITTKLIGGAANIWDNSDKWAVGSFIPTLNKKDVDGKITANEKILVDYRDGDTLYINADGRGYDGSVAQSFLADDYCELLVTTPPLKKILEALSWLFRLKADDADVVHNTGNEAIAGDKNFLEDVNFDLAPTSDVAASAPEELVRKQEADAISSAILYGDGSDGDKVVSGSESLVGGQVYEFNDLTIPAGQTLSLISGGKPMILKIKGNFVLEGTINLDGFGGAGGAGGDVLADTIGAGAIEDGADGATPSEYLFDGSHDGAGGDSIIDVKPSGGNPSAAASGGAGAGASAAGSNSANVTASAIPITANGVSGGVILDYAKLANNIISSFIGAGGGGGGAAAAKSRDSDDPTAVGGDGGNGGGGLIAFVQGTVSGSGVIKCNAANGENGVAYGGVGGTNGNNAAAAAGGGGGAGGHAFLYFAGVDTSAITFQNAVGSAGTGDAEVWNGGVDTTRANAGNGAAGSVGSGLAKVQALL